MKWPDLGAVPFDADGTLLDTAPELARAPYRGLAEAGGGPLPLEEMRPRVSPGARALVRLGFGDTRDERPETSAADGLIEHPRERLEWLP